MNVLKVLIVDDDATMRIGLKSMIPWEQHGYELIGDANDGKQELELVHAHSPHIIITDMKMPVMDGISLIRTLKKENFPCTFLVLSSYDDFDLVKAALKLGAIDYLLKLELDSHALLSSLAEARKKLALFNAVSSEHIKSRTELQTEVLRKIICNHFYTEAEMIADMRNYEIKLNSGDIYCFFLKFGDFFRFEESTEEDYYTLIFSIVNVALEIANDCFYAYCIDGKTSEFYILASIREFLLDESPHVIAHSTAMRLHEMLKQYLNLNCTIGVSSGSSSLKGIRTACQQAVEAARSQYYIGNKGVIFWDDCPAPIHTEFPYNNNAEILQLKNQLKNSLTLLRSNDVSLYLKSFNNILSRQSCNKNGIIFIMLEVFVCVREVFDRFGVQAHETLRRSWRTYREFLSIQDTREATTWIDMLKQDLIDYIDSETKKEYYPAIMKAKNSIDKHYHTKITLSSLAAEVHLDPSYLSSLMKKYLGLNYSEYLVHVRMENAKERLIHSRDKISTIAESVGYPDQFYFNKAFKRVNGITPGEYRKRFSNSF